MARPEDEIDRFFSDVEFGKNFNGARCLIWTGPAIINRTQGLFALNDSAVRVDPVKYAYALEHGDEFLAAEFVVAHRCRQIFCVNFSHIICIESVSYADAARQFPHRELDVARQQLRSDWCRNGEHLRSEHEKKDTYGRPFCSGCAAAADKRRRERDRAVRAVALQLGSSHAHQ